MFEDATSKILWRLQAPEITAPFQDLGDSYLLAAGNLKKVDSLDSLFDALISMEALVCARVGEHLKRYNLDVPIKAQPGLSEYPMTQGSFLLWAYQQVLSDASANAALTSMMSECFGPLTEKFPDSQVPINQDRTVQPFLLAARQIIVLSLAVGKNYRVTKDLFNQFRAVSYARVGVGYESKPSSLAANTGLPSSHCVSIVPVSSPATLRERYSNVRHGTGGSSALRFPVWLPDSSKDIDRQGTPFKFITVQDALTLTLSGSLSFAAGEMPYYSPPRFDILHELIHVLHNAYGENREKAGNETKDEMTAQEQVVWSNPEEYWTIEGARSRKTA
jgi:hypothetical protein